MKLLIVDDEELTRTGVISSINWKSLGIDEVLQADDGLHGLEMARLHRPEIILCDVRMPRMDGIAMLSRLESFLPDAVPIFMSGYSDKEYLKAAIRLKAVNYIEKPLNLAEIREAVLEAKELYLQKLRLNRGRTLHSRETSSRLALQLTIPYGSNSGTIDELAGELSLNLTSSTCFTTFIVRLEASAELTDTEKDSIYHELAAFVKAFHLDCVFTERHAQHFVYCILGNVPPSSLALRDIAGFLCGKYSTGGKYMVIAGETFSGISRAYQSYASAVILLQSSFFFPANSVLFPESCSSASSHADSLKSCSGVSPHADSLRADSSALPHAGLPDAPEAAYASALLSRDKASCDRLLLQFYQYFSRNRRILINQSKDLYYKLLIAHSDARKQSRLTGVPGGDNVVDALDQCFNFDEMHQVLADKTTQFFSDIENAVSEHSTIYLIKEYISKNYARETLSVKDISSHVYLSTSYVCTFFKNETGQTLNQYLTEYRMARAKELLGDPRYRISDISSRVGYSDGNYFGKSFKKYYGLTPSEYREKIMT